MASDDDALNLDYDERGDVLYASLGSPQAALSYELTKDVWLDYIPPSRAVVGITVVNFLAHYPVKDRQQMLPAAQAVVRDLLRQYPAVPFNEEAHVTAIVSEAHPYVQGLTITTLHNTSSETTLYIGMVAPVQSPDIQSSPIVQGAHAR